MRNLMGRGTLCPLLKVRKQSYHREHQQGELLFGDNHYNDIAGEIKTCSIHDSRKHGYQTLIIN